MSEENNMDLFPTPPQDSYESSIQEGGNETELTGNESNSAPEEEALFSFDDTPSVTSVISSDGGKQTENLGRSGRNLDRLEGYTTRFGDLDQAFADAAINQGVWGALGNGAVRAAAEVVGGSIEGMGALVSLFDSERLHHQNFLEEIGQTVRESTDGFEIWERNQGAAWQFTDAAWWAKNLPSIASSLSMMVPGMAVARGVSLLGKGARLAGKAARISAKTKKGLAIAENAAQQIGGGFGMRHAENMREAHDVYNTAKEDVLNSGYSYTMFEGTDGWQAFAREHNRAPSNMEELADYIGGAAAKRAYQINSMNLISDIAQFSSFGKLFKATRGAATAATAAKLTGKETTKRGAAGALAGKFGKFAALDMGSEGAEEIVNFIGGEEGKYHGMRLAGMGSASSPEDRLATYMSDDHMWEAGFFGALGGGVFTGARSATSKIKGAETKVQEQIAANAEARQSALARTGEVADKVAKGEMTAAEGRDTVNNMVFEGAHSAAVDGTVDIFAENVEAAAAQMEKEGVSAEQVKQFREDSAEAIKIAEAAVQEVGTVLASMPDLSPEASTLLRGQFAHNAMSTNRNRVLRDSVAKRLEGHKNLPEQRAQALSDLQAEITGILNNSKKDSSEYKEAEALQKFVNELAAENPVAEQENIVDDAAVSSATENQSMAQEELATADAKVAELQGKDVTSMTEGAKTQLANELAAAYDSQKAAQASVEKYTEELAKAEEGTPPPPVKVDDLVYEDVLLEAEGSALVEQKTKILSKENIDSVVKEGEEFKKKLADAKALKEELEGMTDEELELQKKRAHNNKERQAAINNEIKKRKLAKANDQSTAEEQRSKDIEVGAIAQAAIDKMVADTQNQELVDENGNPADGNGKYYRDKRDGKLRMRVTSFIGEAEAFKGSSNYGIMASNVGNSIDLYIRDYMDGNIGQNEYPHLPQELRPALDEQLATLEAGFVAKGEKVVPHDITLISDTTLATDKDSNVVGIAGTVDLITVDKDGVLRVYDMKTMRDALAEKAIYKDGKRVGSGARLVVNKDGTTSKFGPRQDQSQSNKYNKQTSLYALMAENSTGLQVASTALIPIDVSYGKTHKENVGMSEAEAGQESATRAVLLPNIPQERLEEVNGYKKEEDTNIPDEIVPDDTTPADDAVKPDDATPTDEPSAPVELELDDMSLPMTGILSYFAERLEVSKDWGRDHMLVHSSAGPLVITDEKVAEIYGLIQKAITPNSGAVVRVETRSTGNRVNRVEFGDFYGSSDSASIEGVSTQDGTKENKNRNRSYTPNAADGVEMVITINGVEVGVMPTVSELLQAADQRRLLERRDFRKSFSGTTRVGKTQLGENALMSEISADAHFTAALNIQKFRQAAYSYISSTGALPVIQFATVAGRTALGNRAFGSLILDKNKVEEGLTAEATGDATVLSEGVAIMLPGTGNGQALQVMGAAKTLVNPYASNEKEGSSTTEQASYSSGALFMPVTHNGETLWVKAPGQSISQLANGEKIGEALTELVRSGSDVNIAAAQNLLGSNAIRKTESGNWAIYPTNQNGGIIADLPPLTEAVGGVWTNDISTIIPQMPLDIAVSVEVGESAYKSGGMLSLIPEGKEDGITFKNLAEFASQNVRLGHAPVTNAKGEILGWTHPLAPAVSNFDTGKNRVYNENTNKTQLKVRMRPQTIEGVSGANLVQELTATEETEAVAEAQAPQVTPEVKAAKKEEAEAQKEVAAAIEVKPQESILTPVINEAAEEARREEIRRYRRENRTNRRRFLSVERAEAATNGEKATPLDMKVAEEWWSKNMPNVPFKRVKGMIQRGGTTAYGIFEAGAVEVSNLAVVGTEYHEAFHAVFHMFLDPKRQEKVLAEMRKKHPNKNEEQLEEELAEEFREYMLTDGLSNKDKSVVRRFFSELMELIGALVRGNLASTRVYQGMNRGTFSNMTPRTNEFTTRFMKAIPYAPEYTAPVIEELQGVLRRYVGEEFRMGVAMNSLSFAGFNEIRELSKEDFESKYPGMSRKQALTGELIGLTMSGTMRLAADDASAVMPADSMARQNLTNLFDGQRRAAVIEHFSKDSKFQAYVEDLISNEHTVGTNATEQYDEKKFQKMNPKDSLSQTVRDLIEATPQITRATMKNSSKIKQAMATAELAMLEVKTAKENNNEKALEQAHEKLAEAIDAVNELSGKTAHSSFFGLPRGMNVDLNFPFLSQKLATAATPQDMLARLMTMGEVYPEFKLLAMNLQDQSVETLAQFFTGMKRTGSEEVSANKGRAELSETFTRTLSMRNQASVAAALADIENLDKWSARIVAIKNDDFLSQEQKVKKLGAILTAMGFGTIDSSAFETSLELAADAGEQNLNNLFTYTEGAVRAYKALQSANDDTQSSREKGFVDMIDKLSAYFADNDRGAVSSTLTNVEGTRIFSKQVPSFIGKWFDQFEQREGETDQMYETRVREQVFADPRMYVTNYGHLIFGGRKNGEFNIQAARRMGTRRYGGMAAGAGTTYTNMTDQQTYEYQLSVLKGVRGLGSMYPVTTLSDAGNSYIVPAVVFNPSTPAGKTKALTALKGIIFAEVTELRQRKGRFSNPAVNAYMRSKFATTKGDFFTITTSAQLTAELDKAAEILLEQLMNEANTLAGQTPFINAHESSSTGLSAEDTAKQLTVTGYISNASTAIALAGTANEFKQKADGNTTDMQKRHKHIASPAVVNAGVTQKTHFRSVTMKDVRFDLTDPSNGGTAELAKFLTADGKKHYGGVEIADAQTYVTLDFYETILLEHGDMTPELQTALDKARTGEALSASEKQKLFRPYKPFYYSRTLAADGMLQSQQIKNSIIPVFEAMPGDFGKLAAFMSNPKNKIDQVQMGTAHKVGNTKEEVELIDAETGEFKVVKFSEDNVHTLPMDGYGKQVHVTDHWHDDSTNKMMSQMERIAIAHGVLNRGEEGVAARNKFMSALDSIYSNQSDNLFKKFESESGTLDKEAFRDFIIEKLEAQDVPAYVLDQVQQGNFTSPTVIGSVRTALFSSIENEAKQVRIFGGTQVQISSQFYSTRKNRLKGMRLVDGKVAAAQIVVNRDYLPKTYKGDSIADMSFAGIKSTHPELLEMFCVRIPSEAPNSGSMVEVVEFLPEGQDGAIVPDEFVTQMGSDFDVDKLVFQWRDTKAKTTLAKKSNELYDIIRETYMDPRMLESIQAPQGFDTLSDIAEKRGLRTVEEQQFIKDNPYAVTTHTMMLGDNRAGIALKGQAANKNLILQDFIRNGFVFKADFKLGNASTNASFDSSKVSNMLVQLHTEMVAAAMDGAKDPVYGKLGVNNNNFGLFSALLMMTNGNLDFAVDVIQSEPMQMVAKGHIEIKGTGKNTVINGLTTEGKTFIGSIAIAMNLDMKSKSKLELPANRNLIKTKSAAKSFDARYSAIGLMASGIGQFQHHVVTPLNEQGDAMRVDRAGIANGVEKTHDKKEVSFESYDTGVKTPIITQKDYATSDGERTRQPFDIETKGTVRKMFLRAGDILTEAGDNYLLLRRMFAGSKLASSMTFPMHDEYIRHQAALEIAADSTVYTAMGERTTRNVSKLPELKENYSLEQWTRVFNKDLELLSLNEDLALVLSKIQVNPSPYKQGDSYYDNVMLMNVNDDMEMIAVQKALNNLYESGNTDFALFADAIGSYEAQRSRYGLSQSRFTRVLPDALQAELSAESGAAGINGIEVGFDSILAIHQAQVHNPNLPYMSGETAEAALEEAFNRQVKGAYKAADNHIILPVGEDEKGVIEYILVKSPNDGQKFAGKPVDLSIAIDAFETGRTQEEETEVRAAESGTTGAQLGMFESRLAYGKDNSTAAKVAHLEARFAKAGIPVTIKFDSTLDVNGQVVIDKGAATITMHPDKLQRDTVAHEFGHVLVEALGFSNPLVQQAIEELKGSKLWNEVSEAYPDLDARNLAMEVLVTSIGREASDIFESGDPKTNRFRTTMNRILRAIGKVFGITPKATSQLAEMLMDDGPLPALSEKVSTVQQQRRKKTGTSVAEDFKQKWGELAQQFQTRKFTSTEFEVAASRLSRQHALVTKKPNVGTKLVAIHQVAKTELLTASAVTSRLAALTGDGFAANRIGDKEAIALSEAHSTLQSLETLRSVLEGMDPEAGGSVKIREAYENLQEELDRIINAELVLKEQLAETLSKQLVNNSTNPKLIAWANNPENYSTIFDLVNDPEMRDMMTDVNKATMGTLGVKEFNNPVMQLIAKQIADTVEQGRIDGRQAEIRIANILKKAKAEGVELSDIVDLSTGKFITEYTAEYTEGAREARIMLNSGREGEWIKFHVKNSELPQNSAYYKSFRFPTVGLRAKVEEVNELKTARKLYGLKSYDSAIEQAEVEMHAMLEAKKEMMAEFNDFAVNDGFDAARAEAMLAGEEALRKFDAEHGVMEMNGELVPMNEHSRFVTMTVKPEYKNENYPANAEGRPVPKASQKNPRFNRMTPTASAALTAIRKEMKDGLGKDSKFLEDGDVPFIKSASNETGSILERLKNKKKSVTKGVQNLTDSSQDLKNAERVLIDSSGNPIYTRDRIARPATAEEMAGLNMDSFASMLGESVKRAHLESAKAGLEPFAYMTRDVFNQSDVVDGKHVILMGSKGERARQWRAKKVAGTNTSVALDSWLEGMLGDNWEDASRLDGAVASFQTYTSLMGVGINVMAWFNNFAYGNIQRHLETAGGEHYDKAHGKRAWSIVSSDIITLTNDIVSGKRSDYSSRTSALINLLDIADDQREMPFGKRETKSSTALNALFVGQTMGEVLMQNQTAFAMMMNQEVTLADGSKSNLFDCFVFEDGNVKLPEGATVERNGETVALDNNYLAGFRNKAKSLNHHIHGAYNKQDSGTWQRVAWGRAAMQFRRWLPMNIKKRFGTDAYNESRERQEAGWYTSMWQFLGIIGQNLGDMKAMKEAVGLMKEESPYMYKGAMRALTEVGSGIAGFLALALMYGMLDEEDEDNYWVGLGLNRAQRLTQEMNTYTPWGLFETFNSMAENPFAAMTRMDGGLKVLSQMVEDGAGYIVHGEGMEHYKSGVNKGKTKLGTLTGKMVPGISHGMRLMQVGEMQKQYSTSKNIADWFEG